LNLIQEVRMIITQLLLRFIIMWNFVILL